MSIITIVDDIKLLELSNQNQDIYNQILPYINNVKIIFYILDNNITELIKNTNNGLTWNIWRMKDLDRFCMVDKLITYAKKQNNDMIIETIKYYEIQLSKKIVDVLQIEDYRDIFTTDYMSCCFLLWTMKYMYIHCLYVLQNMEDFDKYYKNYLILIDKVILEGNITENQRFTLKYLKKLITSYYY